MSMAERHSAVLAELTELNLAAARELTAGLADAETPEAKASFALALGRVSRSIRQCVALEAKLARDAKRDVRQDEAQVVNLKKARVDRRKAQVKATVERIVRLEHESDEAEDLLEQFELLLDEDCLSDGFVAEPIETQVARLCGELGLEVTGPPPQGEVSRSDGGGPPRTRSCTF